MPNVRYSLNRADQLFNVSDGEIKTKARYHARECRSIISRDSSYPLDKLLAYASRNFVVVPKLSSTITEQGIIKRLMDETWWRQQLRKQYRKFYEAAAIENGLALTLTL